MRILLSLRLNRIVFVTALTFVLLPYTIRAQSTGAGEFFPGLAECTIDACAIDSPIVMDGRLSESCWDMAEPATGFIQREPLEGKPATEKTEVRVLYDDMNLYIGVLCYDREPELIIHSELGFDENLDQDDSFRVVLDTSSDQPSVFATTLEPLETTREKRARAVNITISTAECGDAILTQIIETCRQHPGDLPLLIILKTSSAGKYIAQSNRYHVSAAPELVRDLKRILGPEQVWIS
ncbi:hypothetical protein ACFL55_01025 [Candidatus Latescibacterota bacterium]